MLDFTLENISAENLDSDDGRFRRTETVWKR
jgi:hypothetical protein